MLEAAVLVPIVLAAEPYTLCVRRAKHLRRNPGQVAFPGGLIDPGESPEDAALRECWEEIGIPPERFTLVGRLDETVTITTSVSIVPVIATIRPPVELRLDGREIAGIYEVPLAALFRPGAVYEGDEPYRGVLVRTWMFDHQDMHIWGATGRILRVFIDRYAPDGGELTRSGL